MLQSTNPRLSSFGLSLVLAAALTAGMPVDSAWGQCLQANDWCANIGSVIGEGCRTTYPAQCGGCPLENCALCDPSCETCDAAGPSDCTSCPSGEFVSDGVCIPCNECGEGTFEAEACSADSDAVCPPCDSSCEMCSGPTAADCTSCSDGQFMEHGACETCNSCEGGYVVEACTANEDTECSDCDPSCGSCSGPGVSDCTTCANGFLEDDVCVSCSVCEGSTFPSVPCSSINDTECSDCDESCSTCTGAGPDQCTCGGGEFASDSGCSPCSECPPGSFTGTECGAANDTDCDPCDSACLTCSGPGASACLSCREGEFLEGGACHSCSDCEAGTFQAATCTAVADTACDDCNPFCAECVGPDSTQCTACYEGQYLADGSCWDCTSCPDDTIQTVGCTSDRDVVCADCVPCPIGTFPLSTCGDGSADSCAACTSDCAICDGPAEEECRDDRDTDGDTLSDRLEVTADNPTDPDDPDSDGDGLCDGPGSVDDCEGAEDENANGMVDADETDPNQSDSDSDGLDDRFELLEVGTDPLDDDSDDDGLLDGTEASTDSLNPFQTNPNQADSDFDSLTDGLELGLAEPEGNDTNLDLFVADRDSGETVTDPLARDSDLDCLPDGEEDSNGNGIVDDGETDPNVADSLLCGDDGTNDVDAGVDRLDAVIVDAGVGEPPESVGSSTISAATEASCDCRSVPSGKGHGLLLLFGLLLAVHFRREL